jgi:hypothetical protein
VLPLLVPACTASVDVEVVVLAGAVVVVAGAVVVVAGGAVVVVLGLLDVVVLGGDVVVDDPGDPTVAVALLDGVAVETVAGAPEARAGATATE